MGQAGRLPRYVITVLVFGALWYMLVERLAQYWVVQPEYSFGWLVPVLCFYLFFIRWRSRPTAAPPHLGWSRLVFGVTAFGLGPTWLIAQANPDWRIAAWLLTAETVGLSLGAIYWIGGKSWLRHFGFSVCLMATATPWPTVVESKIIHTLTELSTVVTVSALNLVQIDAVRHGSVIALRTGMVGLDEACSGIQSLQAGFMLALFLGELYRASIGRRVALLLCSAMVAFLCNGLRTLSLAAVAAKQGTEAIASWHDPLGYILMASCFLLIIAVARVISGPLPALASAVVASSPRSYPYRLILSLGAWLLFVISGTEIWYLLHAPARTVKWSIAWPVRKSEFSEIPISKAELDQLAFSEGHGGEWTDADGSHWVAYLFKWAPGPGWSRILARGHRPEVCFPAAGYKSCGDHGMIEVQTEGLSIPFHALDFEDGGKKSYVFFCLWEEGLNSSERPRPQDRWSQFTRLRSVLLGQRNLAQQTLEIVVSGYDSPEQAETAFRREIVTLIKTGAKVEVADASGSLVLPQVAKRQ
jgi:exosortase